MDNIMSMSKNDSNHLVLLKEKIRLVYVHVLKTYLQIHNEYRHIRFSITDELVKKKFDPLDQHFYDEIGKLRWENIQSLMPPNLEKKVKRAYKMLCENEIRLCCLLLFDVNTSDIINILPYTNESVYVVTNRIKRKTGMNDIIGSLNRFLFAME